MHKDDRGALALASEAGKILLQNGAEIARVEETMERIADHFGEDQEQFFVLSNGIFTTGRSYAQVQFIPIKGARLDKVVEINQLSREIAEGKLNLEQAWDKLEAIKNKPAKGFWEQNLAAFIGCGAFCAIFGGSLFDCLASAIAATFLNIIVLKFLNPYCSKACGSIIAGFLGALFCLLLHGFGLGDNLGNMLVGTLILLIPGVAFTNGLRDIAEEDYLAGLTRLADAGMIFLCIAVGACCSLLAASRLLPFCSMPSGTLTDPFTSSLLIQLAAAFLGTGAFAVLFGVPRKHYFSCALIAGSTLVALCSRWAAIIRRCPSTVYLICGIFPLIPGAGIFWSAFHIAHGSVSQALNIGLQAIQIAFAMVIVLIIVSNIFHRK